MDNKQELHAIIDALQRENDDLKAYINQLEIALEETRPVPPKVNHRKFEDLTITDPNLGNGQVAVANSEGNPPPNRHLPRFGV